MRSYLRLDNPSVNNRMLEVYTFKMERPLHWIDLSMTPLDELAQTVEDICAHQTDVRLWFGYLDGWMLTPHEEVILRKALRKFTCGVVTAFPLSLSHAWKNEINTLYTERPHGFTDTDNDGRIVHNGSQVEHRHFGS